MMSWFYKGTKLYGQIVCKYFDLYDFKDYLCEITYLKFHII